MRKPLALAVALAVVVIAWVAAGAAGAATLHVQLVGATGENGYPPAGVVRTPDGTLHIVYATKLAWSNSADGVAATSISASGHLGKTVQALSGWNTGIPGLVAMPSGALEAMFGGGPTNGSTGVYSGPWGVVSTDGGATWSAPTDVGSHTMEAFAGDTTVNTVAGNPTLTLPQAGGLVVQQGLGTAAQTAGISTPPTLDGFLGNVDAVLDAATGQLVAGWYSSASPGGLWFQAVAPTVGAAQKVPGPVDVGQRQQLVLANRSPGAGVFAAYAPDAQSMHIRLLRYGGGSVAVGEVKGLHAQELGVATGLDGRIWVMWWGSIAGRGVIALTRSNKAVTRFEPIQAYTLNSGYMWRLGGDGLLGPLDLLVNFAPAVSGGNKLVNGIYHARVLPLLSAKASAQKLKSGAHKVTVTVTDAGDAVAGAKVTVQGKTATTSSSGVAKLTLGASTPGHVKLTVTSPGYRVLTESINIA
jgi:hypothetical protein